MKSANSAVQVQSEIPLIDSPSVLIDRARCALLADYRGMNCIDFSEAHVARLAWQYVLTGDPVSHDLCPAYRDRVLRRADYLREIRDAITPRLWRWAADRQGAL